MARVYQVPGHAFPWLIIAAFFVVLPHMIRAELWFSIVTPLLLLWRIQIQRGRLPMPGRLMRGLLLSGLLVLTLYSHGTLLGPEAGATLLVAAFALKMLEMFRLRDAYIVIILACFVLAMTFLFYRGPLVTAYTGVVLILVIAALVGVSHPESGVSSWRHLRLSTVMVLQSLPLMLVLFLLVPRMPPIWNMEVDQQRAKTGMSDSMAPGEVSRLSRQGGIAFRVEFEGALPSPQQRYWRGLTYGFFDGRRWSQAVPSSLGRDEYVYFMQGRKPDWYQELIANRGSPDWNYRVIMEPSGRRWLYALSVPFSANPDIGFGRDLRLVRRDDTDASYDYRVSSYLIPVAVDGLPKWELDFYLALPPDTSPNARIMAEKWRIESSDDAAYIERLLRWFSEEEFYYTLEPPLLGENTVDDFLFRTRRGFCEHYSSSFAFMLRAAGIPARIVAGYQGGELNPLGNHLLVRQHDAHAWVEAWLPEMGWVEFDPTAAVAPARIELGLEQALAESNEPGVEAGFAAAMRNIPLFSRMEHLADYLEFAWTKWVLGYNQQSQLEFLSRWLGKVTPERMVMALAAVGGSLMTVMLIWMLWRARRPGLMWWQREYQAMLSLMRKRGLSPALHLPPAQLIDEAAQRYPRAASALQDWQQCFEAAAYRPPATDQELLRRRLALLRRKVARLSRR